MFPLCRCQLRHIHHASINIATSILGGRRWHDILRIRLIPTRYWRSLWIWSCVLWRSAWLLKNRGKLKWINDQIIQWMRHRCHQWWKLIDIWVNVLAIKALVITRSVLWRSGWMLTNRGHMRWINYWSIQCRRHRYHRWWKLISLWVTSLAIKALFISRSCLLPTLIFPCSTLWQPPMPFGRAMMNAIWVCDCL